MGLANVGKSTFFQAITKSTIGNPANYPFATIDPEEARVIVPSPRFDALCKLYNPRSRVPATLTLFDIAGLTKGASKGEGLGNAFLSHIRSVDGLFQMVRAFEDPDIIHIEKTVDPVRDLEIIRDELILKDMEFVLKHIELAQRALRHADSSVALEKNFAIKLGHRVLEWLEQGKTVVNGEWSADDIPVLNSMNLLTAKPSVYIANISENDYIDLSQDEGNTNLPGRLNDVNNWVQTHSPGDMVIPVSVTLEERLSGLTAEELAEEAEILGIHSALPSAVIALRQTLGLISFFTTGQDEVREWTIQQGTRAPQAAGVIHKDLEKSFILANVTRYEDVIANNGDESKLKSLGKISQKGKDYIMEDSDIVHFKSAAAKK